MKYFENIVKARENFQKIRPIKMKIGNNLKKFQNLLEIFRGNFE